MKFWDSSAVVPLLVRERSTPFYERLYARDPDMTVWWGTGVECVSALARYERDPRLSASVAIQEGFRRLEEAASRWHEIAAGAAVKEVALALLRRHALRAADALQLAAALTAREHRPSPLEFVCADRDLLAAAKKEGLATIVAKAD